MLKHMRRVSGEPQLAQWRCSTHPGDAVHLLVMLLRLKVMREWALECQRLGLNTGG
jgi:hypothetical protein